MFELQLVFRYSGFIEDPNDSGRKQGKPVKILSKHREATQLPASSPARLDLAVKINT